MVDPLAAGGKTSITSARAGAGSGAGVAAKAPSLLCGDDDNFFGDFNIASDDDLDDAPAVTTKASKPPLPPASKQHAEPQLSDNEGDDLGKSSWQQHAGVDLYMLQPSGCAQLSDSANWVLLLGSFQTVT
jgi:hypothetical protein